MTFQEAIQVAEGIIKAKKDDYNRSIMAARALTCYINNSLSKNPKPFDKVWKLEYEQEEEVKPKKWTLPAKYIVSIISGINE